MRDDEDIVVIRQSAMQRRNKTISCLPPSEKGTLPLTETELTSANPSFCDSQRQIRLLKRLGLRADSTGRLHPHDPYPTQNLGSKLQDFMFMYCNTVLHDRTLRSNMS